MDRRINTDVEQATTRAEYERCLVESGHASRSVSGLPVDQLSTHELYIDECRQIRVIAAEFPRCELKLSRAQGTL